MQQVLDTPLASEEDSFQAWMSLILLDKLVAHTKTDPSISLNATMRQRLRQAQDGEWLYLANDVLDKWSGPRNPAPTTSQCQRGAACLLFARASRSRLARLGQVCLMN